MPRKGASGKEAALAAPSVQPVKIEIPVPSAPKYVPGSGPRSEPITLVPVKDSTAYILDKYVLPKLSETRPQDRRLYYYLVGFTDIPQARILVPCHKALDYVDPYEMERWEYENDEKIDEEKKRLAEEATKLPAKKRGRPAKVRVGPGAIEPDISQPSPHGTSFVPSVGSLSDNQHEPTLVLDNHLTGPSLSTPQKRTRPSLNQVGDSQTTPSPAQPTTNNQFGDEQLRRQLFWESTKRRLSSDYSANGDADVESISQPLIMDSSASRPTSSRASSSGGHAVLNASGSTRVTRSASKRPGSALSAGSSSGSPVPSSSAQPTVLASQRRVSALSARPPSASGVPVPSSSTHPTMSASKRPVSALSAVSTGSGSSSGPGSGFPVTTQSGSGTPAASTSTRPTRAAAKRPSSGGSAGSAAGTPIHPEWAQIMKISNKINDLMDGAAQGGTTTSTSPSGAGSPVGNPLTRPSPATPWGFNRFPLPNEQGYLHTTPPPAPPAPPVEVPEPSTNQKKRARKEPTTSTSLPNKKQRKGKGKQAAEKVAESEGQEGEAEDEVWSVKQLLDDEFRYPKGQKTLYYLVDWTGNYEHSWEPSSHIQDPELIRIYREKKKNGTLPVIPVRTPYASVDAAFRGGINDEATWNRQIREQEAREAAEEEEKPLSVV